RGRRNLATNMIYVMRAMGMRAFQTTLLPHLAGAEVKRLNSIGYEALRIETIPNAPEIERAIVISKPVSTLHDQNVHLAGEPIQVLLNLRRWNDEIADGDNSALWGRRTVKYFVFDGHSGEFAPSKFCAYVPVYTNPTEYSRLFRTRTAITMSLSL